VIQLLGVVGDGEEPLVEVTLLDVRSTAPADTATVGVAVASASSRFAFIGFRRRFDLRVSKHCLTVRTPVHRRRAVVDQPLIVELGEQPLVPLVVVGVAGSDFPGPVVAKAHLPEVVFHLVDTGSGPGFGVSVPFVGRVLRRQAEGVPPHRVKHLVTGHPPIPGVRVGNGVVSDVPHMQRAGGVGKHSQHVRRVRSVGRAFENALSLPGLLPVLLNPSVVISARHLLSRPVLAAHISVRLEKVASRSETVVVYSQKAPAVIGRAASDCPRERSSRPG